MRTDSEMLPLDGNNQYIIHFAANSTPPVSGFWSITLYNNQHFLVDNAIDRYAVGDRTPMKYNADGSLDIYIQHDSPGEDQESNWLPAPCEGFNLYLRQYWPTEDIMTKTWIPPAVIQVSKIQAESSATPAAQSSLPLGFALIGAGIAFIIMIRRE